MDKQDYIMSTYRLRNNYPRTCKAKYQRQQKINKNWSVPEWFVEAGP